ncbi:protein of unknown function [Moritella yayanosii]|uniref:Uncharacterized protein n=1 Tax=Moritella yayanosii TaxID=69539 RepID=A0A330LPB4_9GAMM|nr:protein of unknown function [Moritella yayanosii]
MNDACDILHVTTIVMLLVNMSGRDKTQKRDNQMLSHGCNMNLSVDQKASTSQKISTNINHSTSLSKFIARKSGSWNR